LTRGKGHPAGRPAPVPTARKTRGRGRRNGFFAGLTWFLPGVFFLPPRRRTVGCDRPRAPPWSGSPGRAGQGHRPPASGRKYRVSPPGSTQSAGHGQPAGMRKKDCRPFLLLALAGLPDRPGKEPRQVSPGRPTAAAAACRTRRPTSRIGRSVGTRPWWIGPRGSAPKPSRLHRSDSDLVLAWMLGDDLRRDRPCRSAA
jgi:hypothetical protein